MATEEVRNVAPYGGRNDDPRRQRLLARLRRGPVVVPQTAAPNLPPLPQRPDGPEFARRYNAAAAKAQPLFDAAERTLAVNPLQREVAATKGPYVKASTALAADLQVPDYVKAQANLSSKEEAARAVLAAKGKVEAASRNKEQHESQAAAYNEMAPVLADVKRSNVPLGMAGNIGKNHKNAEAEFKNYLAKLQALEDAKAGVDPAKRVAPALAGTIIGTCQAAVAAAQAYLAHYDKDLSDAQKRSAESLSRKQHCEEGIKSASQYALAMEIDRAGPPMQDAPWDPVTRMRVAGAQAQFRYEQGNKKLQGLDDDGGGKGASDSYWLRSKSIAEVGDELRTGNAAKGSREFIFKPADGEDAPIGMKEHHQQGAGAAKEALASSNAKLFAAQTGIDLGVPETTVVSMGQHALKNGDLAGAALVGSAQQLASGASTEVGDLPNDTFRKIKPREIQKIALLDIMSLSMDRHGGNIMVDTSDPADPKLIPIDHGATLPGRQAFSATKARMGGIGLEPVAGPVNTLLKMPSAFEPFDPDIVAGLDMLRPEAIEADMKAQLAAMDEVHEGLDASRKVDPDSLSMSKRSLMFLKKAAKLMSPAEVQIALAQHGEALFDAPDDETAINNVADRIIADALPKKAAYQEVLGLAPGQLGDVVTFLRQSGWAETEESAARLVMSDPEATLALYKSKTANPAGLPSTPFATPSGGPKLQMPQPEIDDLKRDFPNSKFDGAGDNRKKELLLCYRAFRALGTKADLDRRAQAIGGTPPNSPITGLQVLQAWAALQTPAYQQERTLLPLDAGKPCTDNLKTLMEGKAKQIALTQAADDRAHAAAALDPAATASRYAADQLAELKGILDRFAAPGAAAPLLADWQRLSAKLAQGPAQNQQAQAFAKEVEQETQDLYRQVTAAGLEDARLAGEPFIRQFAGLRMPDASPPQAILESFQALTGIQVSTVGAGNLRVAQESLQKLRANSQAMLAIAVPITPSVQPGQTAAPQRPTTPSPDPVPTQPTITPLPSFDWDQDAGSAVKKQAVKLKLFKDKDTGMTDALKAVNKARTAADTMNDGLPKNRKIALYKAAEGACTEFSRFINGKLRGLSKDRAWSGYCDSAAREAEGQFNKFKALRMVLE
jgi:hypothetical protein